MMNNKQPFNKEVIKSDKIYIYGKHAVEEALVNNPNAVDLVLSADPLPAAVIDIAKEAKIRLEKLTKDSIPRGIDKTMVHQGIIARVSISNLVRPYNEFIENLTVTPDTALVVLGEVQDPQNVGAIIRSAAAFGIAGVLIPEHKQAQINATIVKVSAGMAFRVPLVQIGNVNMTLKDLKEKGFWIYGLEGTAKQSLNTEKFEAASVIVLGNEGEGIREKTLESCDIPLAIPMSKDCESLNVAASAAVALHAWSVRHPKALKK
jgi:23S rRNA (guanosine2251-2'-O)-methyltransferase